MEPYLENCRGDACRHAWYRHRSATDIANSGIPVNVGMMPTAHKSVAMFMRYVHTEDAPVRQAAELVANRRKATIGAGDAVAADIVEETV